ncbi:hypothetical protein [Flexivirga sp.]|uniref:PIN-like domain-containing protein n=1 Tax=Flexivirga sp. TaxID=1962927 RepID=UPI003F7DB7C0
MTSASPRPKSRWSKRTLRGWSLRPDEVGILLDRCVGDQLAKEFDKLEGIRARCLSDMYGTDAAPHVEDVTFLKDAGVHGWMVLTQNPQMWFVPRERETIERNNTHVFCLASAQLPGVAKGFVFGFRFNSIKKRHASRSEACFWRLHSHLPTKKDLR